MKLREKFGGVTEVVPAAEAKKLGLIKTTKVETTANVSGAKDGKDNKDPTKKLTGDVVKDKKSIAKEVPTTDPAKKLPANKEN